MESKIFSLELLVDRIKLVSNERCLFPACVLKFLGYEPALISSINDQTKLKLREYLDFYNRPLDGKANNNSLLQLNQLKDANGSFVIHKGKSILFESDVISLIKELNALPLYILLTDDYYQPSHLIGVATISLSAMIGNLSQKISKFGYTVSEELSGKYPIVNLMGNSVGLLAVRIRLVYIGENIGRHLQVDREIVIRNRPKSGVMTENRSASACSDEEKENKRQSKQLVEMRNIGCQVDRKRTVRIQAVPSAVDEDKQAKIGLTIDPIDPILETPPPLIYNSCYERFSSDSEDSLESNGCIKRPEQSQNDLSIAEPQKFTNGKKIRNNKHHYYNVNDFPLLNDLFKELKTIWKSQENVDMDSIKPIPIVIPNKEESTQPKQQGCRIKQSSKLDKEISTTARLSRPRFEQSKESLQDFLHRMSKPKHRSASPIGKVPRMKGWIRSEPEYLGPATSSLEYKPTKTHLKRLELRNPKYFSKFPPKKVIRKIHRTSKSEEPELLKSSQTNDNEQDSMSSPSYTPIPRQKRNPLVPPLFNPGLSLSGGSTFGQSDAALTQRTDKCNRDSSSMPLNHRRPPLSPGKDDRQTNNSNNFRSYDTNDTVNEADQLLLNLNPVQSNRSPQMSMRSQTVQPTSGDYYSNNNNDHDEDTRQYVDDFDSSYYPARNKRLSDEQQRRSDDYSDDDNSYSTYQSQSRRHSFASQTSEWKTTEYSPNSSMNTNNGPRMESPRSPDLGTFRSPPRSPRKKRKPMLSNAIGPGGRFSDSVRSNNSFKSFDSFKASFDEFAEMSNMNSSSGLGRQASSEIEDDQFMDNLSLMRQNNSVGADLTSFTKVTKYEPSFHPGHSNNLLGAPLAANTVGSMRTDDSQMLTSESYY